MDHNYVKDANFNILTIRRVKNEYDVTGETREPLEVDDTINYISGERTILGIKKIVERRDSRDFPKGNGMWYHVKCVPVPIPDPVAK